MLQSTFRISTSKSNTTLQFTSFLPGTSFISATSYNFAMTNFPNVFGYNTFQIMKMKNGSLETLKETMLIPKRTCY
ncbi:MAG: hypothetical protein K1X82_01355 [Bacteroidia bacterium]|nr:hypothetical protein [Bacteroidia bacterium]